MRYPILWKEWHEQRWKMAFGTVMLAFFTSSFIVARVVSFDEVLILSWVIGANILWLYSAMSAFAPERSNGTLAFLVSKPARPLRVFLTKWFFGWLNFAVPLIATAISLAVSCLAVNVPVNISNIAQAMISAICFGTVLYTLTCCLAPAKSGEAFVGLTGILILLTITLYTMVGYRVVNYLEGPIYQQHPVLAEAIFGTCPFYLFGMKQNMLLRPWPKNLVYFEQAALVVLALWFGYRRWRKRS